MDNNSNIKTDSLSSNLGKLNELNKLNKLKDRVDNNGDKHMIVKFGDVEIKSGNKYPLSLVQKDKPVYYYNKNENNENRKNIKNRMVYHTLVMVDRDVRDGVMIHQCLYNIPNFEFDKASVFYPWYPPTPPVGTGEHRYYFILYSQDSMISDNLQNNNGNRKNRLQRWFSNYGDFSSKIPIELSPLACKCMICSGDYIE